MENVTLCQANSAYLAKQKTACNSESCEPKEQSKPNNKKIIGAVALGTIAIGGLIAFGRYKSAQKLADFIEFKPANTLKEACEFAKKYLKVRKFDLTDLDSANYVNEALVNFNNNISTNHKRIVSSIERIDGDNALASMGSFKVLGGYLGFNEKQFGNMDLIINDFLTKNKITLKSSDLDYFQFDKEQSNLLINWLDKAKRATMTKKEKTQFYQFITAFDYYKNESKPVAWFSNLLSDKSVIEVLKANNLPTTVEEFSKLETKKQAEICSNLISNFGKKLKIQNGGPFQIINHEIGHALHKENVGAKAFEDMAYHTSGDNDNNKIMEAVKKFVKELGANKAFEIEGNISSYAMTGPAEFVAEVYSYLCNGVKFSDGIMELYKKYGGVIPKCAQ